MTKALKCDRCGRFYEIYDGIPLNEGEGKYNGMSLLKWDTSYSALNQDYDLCPECMKSLFEWLKEADNDKVN